VRRHGHAAHWVKKKNEFGTSRPEGWLPPSIQSKLDHHIRWIRRYLSALPADEAARIEVGRFDAHHMKDPSVRGGLYQKGPMYGEENVRAYVFARDNYTCRCCKAKAGTKRKDGSTVKLVAHHIDFRSKGATDNPERMITVCDQCHTTKAHQKGGILYDWMMQEKKVSRGYRDTVIMNILRVRLRQIFPDAIFTYGNITAADRKRLKLDKTHANDAVAIAAHNLETITDNCDTVYYKQLRKQKRSLHEANPRKGLKAKNTEAKRHKKNTPCAGGFWLNDKVRFKGKKGCISGFTNGGAYVKDIHGDYLRMDGKKYLQVPLSMLKLICHNNNWSVQVG
jgi:hypothetical protein